MCSSHFQSTFHVSINLLDFNFLGCFLSQFICKHKGKTKVSTDHHVALPTVALFPYLGISFSNDWFDQFHFSFHWWHIRISFPSPFSTLPPPACIAYFVVATPGHFVPAGHIGVWLAKHRARPLPIWFSKCSCRLRFGRFGFWFFLQKIDKTKNRNNKNNHTGHLTS